MATISKKNSRLAFWISLLWVSSMQNAIFGFNTSVTFMLLAFVSMGLGGRLTFFTVWKYCIYVLFEVLIHYYSVCSSILTFSLQFLLFRENTQFASWVSHNVSRFCVLPLFFLCYSSTFSVPSFTALFSAWKRLMNKSQLYFRISVCLLSSPHESCTGMLVLWPADNSTSADPIL